MNRFFLCLLILLSCVVSLTTNGQGTPYSGAAVTLPGKIEIENYNLGGEGIAYHENTGGNSGGAYRTEDVDIEPATDGTAAFNVGWTDADEWMNYSIQVSTAGNYDFKLRYATPFEGQRIHFEVDGVLAGSSITLPITWGFQAWQTLPIRNIPLPQGNHILKLYLETGNINLNSIEVIKANVHTPFGGTAVQLPGRIELENYDEGMQGIAYNDLTAGNTGNFYRFEDVDIEPAYDGPGAFNVGWTAPGEWMVYTVNVATTDIYDLKLRAATSLPDRSFNIQVNNEPLTNSKFFPNTGGFQNYQTLNIPNIPLKAGIQVFKIFMETGRMNLNYLEVNLHNIPQTPFGGNATTLPGKLEFEKYDIGGEGVAYHETTPGNQGHIFRNDDVDIEQNADGSGSYSIGYTEPGEWLEYSTYVPKKDSYNAVIRYASGMQGPTVHIEVDNVVVSTVNLPSSGGWHIWQNFTLTGLHLPAGLHVIKMVLATGGVNLNYIEVLPNRPYPSFYTVTNTLDSGLGSLRAAIDSANARPDYTYIEFNVPGPGPHIIPSSVDLILTNPAFIDGSTQPGYNHVSKNPVIQIRNNNNNQSWTNIFLFGNSKGSEIKGLYLKNAGYYGIWALVDSVIIRDNVINHLKFPGEFALSGVGFINAGSYSKVLGNTFGTDSTGKNESLFLADSTPVGVYIYIQMGLQYTIYE